METAEGVVNHVFSRPSALKSILARSTAIVATCGKAKHAKRLHLARNELKAAVNLACAHGGLRDLLVPFY